MNRLSRIVLWLLGIAFPAFLAACYGPPHHYSRLGDVGGEPRDAAAERGPGAPDADAR